MIKVGTRKTVIVGTRQERRGMERRGGKEKKKRMCEK